MSGMKDKKTVKSPVSIGRPPTQKELEELFTTDDYPLKNTTSDDEK